MEIEWDYDTVETGTTVSVISGIGTELKNVVTRMFRDSQTYWDSDLVTKYQQVFETLAFCFEDYRDRYDDSLTKRMGDLSQEQKQVEAVVFCSWLSIEVMTALQNTVVKT